MCRIGRFVDEGEVVRLPIGRQVCSKPGIERRHNITICGSVAAGAGVPVPIAVEDYKVSVLVIERVGGVDTSSRTIVNNVWQRRNYVIADIIEVIDIVTDFMVAHDRVPQEIAA